MPYITGGRRADFDHFGKKPTTPGELSYYFTKAITDYLALKSDRTKRNVYSDFNEVLGALEGTKLEFYRRVVAPYEEQKCFDNGDVY